MRSFPMAITARVFALIDPRVEEHVVKAMGFRLEPINRHGVALYEIVGILAAVRDGKISAPPLTAPTSTARKLEEAR